MGLLALDIVELLANAHDDMMVHDIRKRCIRVLLRFSGLRPHPILPLPPATVALSQDELSHAANLTRSPVSRILHELETRGLVRLHYRSIEIVDPQGLAALAEAE
jgi:CRP-like cAMP-binding protein